MKTKIYLINIISCLAINNFAHSQNNDYNKGIEAFNSKNYDKTIELLKSFADSEDSVAQYMVGFSYYYGDIRIKNDTLAEFYLLKASIQKYGRAMGLLSAMYFSRSKSDPQYKIYASVWAEIAPFYDVVQKGLTTRFVIRQYLSESELKAVIKILTAMKKDFERIDIAELQSYTPK